MTDILRKKYKKYKRLYKDLSRQYTAHGGAAMGRRDADQLGPPDIKPYNQFLINNVEIITLSEFRKYWHDIDRDEENRLGSGSYGIVKETHYIHRDHGESADVLAAAAAPPPPPGGREWVLKVAKREPWEAEDEFKPKMEREFYYAYRLGELEIGPKCPRLDCFEKSFCHIGLPKDGHRFELYGNNYEYTDGRYILERYDGTLMDPAIAEHKDSIQTQLHQLIVKMVDANIVCADLKPANILFKTERLRREEEPIKLRLTDFDGDFCNCYFTDDLGEGICTSSEDYDETKTFYRLLLYCIYIFASKMAPRDQLHRHLDPIENYLFIPDNEFENITKLFTEGSIHYWIDKIYAKNANHPAVRLAYFYARLPYQPRESFEHALSPVQKPLLEQKIHETLYHHIDRVNKDSPKKSKFLETLRIRIGQGQASVSPY